MTSVSSPAVSAFPPALENDPPYSASECSPYRFEATLPSDVFSISIDESTGEVTVADTNDEHEGTYLLVVNVTLTDYPDVFIVLTHEIVIEPCVLEVIKPLDQTLEDITFKIGAEPVSITIQKFSQTP